MGVPHYALKDVVIKGYTIPKGATVMASLYHSMRDPNVFKNPEIFDPARYIDAGNNFFQWFGHSGSTFKASLLTIL